MKSSKSKIKNLRRERNAEVLRKLKNGDYLSSFNSYASWYPPRPIIEKSVEDINRLYGTDKKAVDEKVADHVEDSGTTNLQLA